jgi:hypothetical protein
MHPSWNEVALSFEESSRQYAMLAVEMRKFMAGKTNITDLQTELTRRQDKINKEMARREQLFNRAVRDRLSGE